jgi:anti-sigma regulatory factor (Ser/Thr protein kinase)
MRRRPSSTAPSGADELVIELRNLHEVLPAQAAIGRFAAAIGFERRAQWEITIAASEAGTNMVKYAGGGRLTLRRIHNPRPGLRLEARDFGPGIADLERALEDHISESSDTRTREPGSCRGLGVGLGAIQRLMDTLEWHNLEDGGLLRAEKYL